MSILFVYTLCIERIGNGLFFIVGVNFWVKPACHSALFDDSLMVN